VRSGRVGISALGRFPPFATLPPHRQLSGAKETPGKNFPLPNFDRQLLRIKSASSAALTPSSNPFPVFGQRPQPSLSFPCLVVVLFQYFLHFRPKLRRHSPRPLSLFRRLSYRSYSCPIPLATFAWRISGNLVSSFGLPQYGPDMITIDHLKGVAQGPFTSAFVTQSRHRH